MTTAPARLRLIAAVALLAAGSALGILSDRAAPAFAAQKDQPAPKDPLQPTDLNDVIEGYISCSECHGREVGDGKNSKYKKYKSHEFVLLSEGTTWSAEDPHSAAFKVLKGDLGQQMGRILKYDVTKAPQCLTCHALDKLPGSPLPTTEADTLKRFVRGEGVACHACHGLRPPWLTKHTATADTPGGDSTIPWRIMMPEEKEKFGMRNLRDPVVRAKLCASCHVGDPDTNRVVTHDMYAAGHPPLPPFELGTFMNCQPMHWGSPAGAQEVKKDQKERDPRNLTFFTDEGFKAYPGGEDIAKKNPNWMWDLYRTHPEAKEVSLARAISAGAVASLHAEMKLLAADAEAVLKGNEGSIDFARFDCYACHHDLKYPSDRQKRGYGGAAPGRPPLKAWTAALPGVVVAHAAALKPFADVTPGFGGKWDAVHGAALARPFGKPADVSKAAKELADWCDAFMQKDQKEAAPVYTSEEAKKLLAAIGNAAVTKWSADPEAAMHLTWAYVALREHIKDKIPDAALKDLRIVVPVQVRQGREVMGKTTFSNDKGDPLTVGETLRERLDLFNRFKSDDYKRAFGNITGAPKK